MAVQIYELIGKAMADMGPITKDKMNKQQGYKFRGIDDVYNALNPVLCKHGLFVVPRVLDRTREERQTQSGGRLIYSILKVQYTMYAPDGSSIEAVVDGEGMDSADKSTNKAMSAAYKYFMFQLFSIPTEELVDADTETPPPSRQAEKPEVKVVPVEQVKINTTYGSNPTAVPQKRSLNALMNSAIFAFGSANAPAEFDKLLQKHGVTRETMTESAYDKISSEIMAVIAQNAKKDGAA